MVCKHCAPGCTTILRDIILIAISSTLPFSSYASRCKVTCCTLSDNRGKATRNRIDTSYYLEAARRLFANPKHLSPAPGGDPVFGQSRQLLRRLGNALLKQRLPNVFSSGPLKSTRRPFSARSSFSRPLATSSSSVP
ncbi:hypothetical protein RHECNPAF_122100153 [Rhizobium etli CNPAF512]|nr:hypothetical protein RHECNPAF_122100153 [Rhizobium etli CNPAF512]